MRLKTSAAQLAAAQHDTRLLQREDAVTPALLFSPDLVAADG